MIALCIEEILVEAGFAIAGVAGRLAKALALIELAAVDAAIVDANLAGASASPVGKALAARQLPFIVLSGYSAEQQKDAFPDAALFMRKPFQASLLIEMLQTVLRRSNGSRIGMTPDRVD